MSEQKFYMDINEEEQKERAILVGADFDNMEEFDLYMDELKQLARACNMEVVCIIIQKLDMPNKATLIGPGKVDEVKESAVMLDADIVIFDYDKLRDTADYVHPNRLTEGIEQVIVNGSVVYEDMKLTGEYAGKVIRYNK